MAQLCTSPFEDVLSFGELREIDAQLGVVWQPLHPDLRSHRTKRER